ncbi:MAG: DMT family transporter [Oscillospiraceae bacterium]
MKRYLPHIQILLAGSLWGLIGLFNRNLTSGGLSASSIVAVRNIGGLILLGLVLLVLDRSVFKIKLRHLPYFFGTGVVSILLFTLCYFSAQQMCSLAVTAILLYTAPAFVVVLSAILFHDKLTKGKLAALLLAFLGCTFVSGIWSGGLAVTGWGLVLGIASGFFYGLYSIFGRYALAHYQPLTVTFYTFVFAGAGALFLIRPSELSTCFSQPPMVLLAIGLVVVSTVLPYILYTRGLAKLDSGKASILASIEPVVAALVGVLAFGEPMSIMVLLGLICILASVYILR